MKGKMKKTVSLLLALTSVASTVTMASCFGGKEKDAKVLSVKVYNIGRKQHHLPKERGYI